MNTPEDSGMQCPRPIAEYPRVLLAHGGGGRLMHELIERIFISAFGTIELSARHDGAVVNLDTGRLAFTTDSYVVHPLFFPGGDIGMLAVNGTVNDLAMCGARPLVLSAAFILEEGLPVETLENIAHSMRRAADGAAVRIVTGDTKVVERGKGHGVFITTSGVGIIEHDLVIAPSSVRPGDTIIQSGDIGRHGIAIIAVREGLAFETTIESDCAPLAEPVMRLLNAGVEVHCLRDLTRGGLASALVEIAETSRLSIALDEQVIPVREDVRGACELFGFDPLYVANEGRFVAFVPSRDTERALAILRSVPVSAEAQMIGRVADGNPGLVTIKSVIGGERLVDMPSGEQLPRIC